MDQLVLQDGPDFWDVHGVLFLIAIALFPRITMILATPWGGLLWWLGLIFLPRIQVAVLATYYYWETNPLLCIVAWLFCLGGEGAEKSTVARSGRRRRRD